MEAELEGALREVFKWVAPKNAYELVVLSSDDVIRGLCIRIGKRSGIIHFSDAPGDHSVIYRHCKKGGYRAWVSMAFIRVRTQSHRSALANMGLPASGLVMLNPQTWSGWGASHNKFHYWLEYGSRWYEKMKEDAEAWERTKEFLQGLNR